MLELCPFGSFGYQGLCIRLISIQFYRCVYFFFPPPIFFKQTKKYLFLSSRRELCERVRVSQVEHPFYYKYLNEPLIKKNEITNKKNNQINETDEEHQIDTGEAC